MREMIKLLCTERKECGSVYISDKNKKTTQKKIELKKFCKFCRKHTTHREGK
ncbi:MAG: 50S ribosomal protein L33 [Silvanigrellales bacterium]|jgi:large subunit ribosomal protein L33|nr:50S ribosomal protein L33 [Silvanigrellales bacterium]